MKTTKTTTEYVLQGYVYDPDDRGIFWERLCTCTAEGWKKDLKQIRAKWKSGRFRVVKYTITTEVEVVSAKRKNPRVSIY